MKQNLFRLEVVLLLGNPAHIMRNNIVLSRNPYQYTKRIVNAPENGSRLLVLSLAVLFLLAFFCFPVFAYASDGNTIDFAIVMERFAFFVRNFMLPIGIILSAWNLVYIAIFCGLIGSDPLNMFPNHPGGLDAWEVKKAIVGQLGGTLKGLCWVGGIWIVFEICLRIAATLALTFQNAFD